MFEMRDACPTDPVVRHGRRGRERVVAIRDIEGQIRLLEHLAEPG